MKLDRIFSRLIALLLIVLLITAIGCGSESAVPDEEQVITEQTQTTEPVEETPTEEPVAEATAAWQDIYAEVLDAAKSSYGSFTEYLLYDIDHDRTPELFVEEGNSEADFVYQIYTVQDGELCVLGNLGSGHTIICGTTQPGTFLHYFAQMGLERVWLCTLENGTLTKEEIYYCSSVHASEYLPLQSVPSFHLDQPVQLQWQGNPDVDNLAILEQAKLDEPAAAVQFLGQEDFVRLTGICSALYDTNCSMGGHENLSADAAEDRLIFVFAHLLAGDSIMPDAPAFNIDNRPEGRICTISKADMDRLNTYFFGSPLEHGESAVWTLSHNITVSYENGMYTYDSPAGDFGATTGVAAITNIVPDSYGNYRLTLAGFATRPGITATPDYSTVTFELLRGSEDFEFYQYITATVAEQDGQYVVTDIHFAV